MKYDGQQIRPIGRTMVFAEFRTQIKMALPLIFVNIFTYGMQTVTLMFVGHLGTLALSGAALGYSITSVVGFNFIIGLATALDTLCGQAYGARMYRLVGIHMQRAIIIHLVTCVFLSVVLANTGLILAAVGQNAEIAETAGEYARYLIPSVFGYAILQSQTKFFQAQSIMFPMLLMSGLIFFCHIFLCWILISKSELGFKGAALANSISVWLSVLVYSLYIKLSVHCKETWPGFSKEAFGDIASHLKLAIPSTFMICFEFWTFELMVILSGLLPNPQLQTSVLSITLNTSSVLYTISSGLGAAISTRVSNELGAGHPLALKLAIRVILAISTVVGILISLVLVVIRHKLGYAYSKDKEVIAAVAIMMVILAVSNLLSTAQAILSGILRGCGKQKIGAYCNLGAYYLAGVPSAIILAFVIHIGSKGLWIGIMIGLFVQTMSLLIVAVRTNWQHEVVKAAERVNNSNEGAEIASTQNSNTV